jgi:hypothetical protein
MLLLLLLLLIHVLVTKPICRWMIAAGTRMLDSEHMFPQTDGLLLLLLLLLLLVLLLLVQLLVVLLLLVSIGRVPIYTLHLLQLLIHVVEKVPRRFSRRRQAMARTALA